MKSRLKSIYETQVKENLKEQFKYNNIHEIPKILKVTLNQGLGEDAQNAKILETSIKELALISGQKPIITRAKKSIAGFKIREKNAVGLTVNLRNYKMYTFLEKLIHLSLPNIRDFRGINPKSFDGRGNYNLGIQEQLIFPEISYDIVNKINGLDIAIVTTAKTDTEGFALLKGIGMPFYDR